MNGLRHIGAGPVGRLSAADMSNHVSVLRSIAAEVSDRLGFRASVVEPPAKGAKRHAKG